ncbi:DUF3618 domain-containing protein [Streptomyces sp. SBT349]|uniref:DUF3618 domain-containing protein n=1 Tax=Streptomyces sp. SBT349 TaxID=1580539 RepID=UPI00066D0FC5|nr:DUF3618 domain-containing protein [Streptomyces sp. SBT349]
MTGTTDTTRTTDTADGTEELRAHVDGTRRELGETVAALAARANLLERVRAKRDALRFPLAAVAVTALLAATALAAARRTRHARRRRGRGRGRRG